MKITGANPPAVANAAVKAPLAVPAPIVPEVVSSTTDIIDAVLGAPQGLPVSEPLVPVLPEPCVSGGRTESSREAVIKTKEQPMLSPVLSSLKTNATNVPMLQPAPVSPVLSTEVDMNKAQVDAFAPHLPVSDEESELGEFLMDAVQWL